jgi:tRNA-dihydrouridine synthase A
VEPEATRLHTKPENSLNGLPDRRSTRVSIAPMMERTDRHFRYMLRLLAPDVRLYTEMVVAQAAIRGDQQRLLEFAPCEHPIGLQLGGSDPALLAEAAVIGEQWGYDEINLNIGCPSDRVQSGQFGACLMAHPDVVAASVRAIQDATNVLVSVKTRIGIDEHDEYGYLRDFVGVVAAAGCQMFVVHARKAILAGLSPKENRSIPPLKYDYVYRLKQDFPALRIVLNGGVRDTAAVQAHLQHTDGVMIGRQAYSDPYWIAQLQAQLLNEREVSVLPTRQDIVRAMAVYGRQEMERGTRLHHITRHMLGLFAGQPGARNWRRFLTEASRRPEATPDILLRSLDYCASTG